MKTKNKENKIQTKHKLFICRCIAIMAYIISMLFLFSEKLIVGIIFFLLGLFIDKEFYRCPHCKQRLNVMLNVKSKTICPNCGNRINDPVIK